MQDRILEEIQKELAGGNQQRIDATMGMCQRACDLREDLLKKIDKLGKCLPTNTLDHLIAELGGPGQVAVSAFISYKENLISNSIPKLTNFSPFTK